MKKTLSLLLAAVLLLCAFTPAVSAADSSFSLFVASDLHMTDAKSYGSLASHTKLPDNALYPHATMQGQAEAESEAIVKAMLKNFASSDEQILLIGGDLCDGTISTHKAIAALFSAFEKSTSKKIFVIPGNHDVEAESGEKASISDFKSIYAEFGYNEALSVEPTSGSYTADLGGDYRLLAVDSCIYGKDDGQITKTVYDWIVCESAKAKADGKHLIALMHHNLLPHYSLQANLVSDKTGEIAKTSSIAQEFADLGIKYVLTGHLHANDISEATSKSGNRVYDILTGSLTTSPNAYRRITFSDTAVTVKTRYVTSIDTSDLPQGYSDAQLSLIQSDFPAYSKGFFEAGMILWLDRYLGDAAKVARYLKIEEGTPAYAALDKVMAVVGESLKLPIYETKATPEKNDSVEEIANGAGVSLPKSSYSYPYQVVAAIMHAFYAGDGSITSDSIEVKLIKYILAGCVSYAFGTILTLPDLSAAKPLFKALGFFEADLRAALVSESAKQTFANNAAEKVIGAAAEPLLCSLTQDAYAPGDLNETLDSYGTASAFTPGSAPITLFSRIFSILSEIFGAILKLYSI